MASRTILLACSLVLAACSSESSSGGDPSDDGGAPDGASPGGDGGSTGSGGGGAGGAKAAAGGANAASGGAGPSAGGASTSDGGAQAGDGGASPDSGAPPEGPDVDRTDPQLHEFEIDPHDLDPSVVDSLENQYAQVDTRSAPLGKLVIFLGGFTNPPGAWRNHGRKLAEFGFHVVIPAYNNRWSGCDGPNCNEETRWEALTGEDTSTAIVASRADSAEGRTIAILEHLVTEHPGGDWGFYLDGGALRYERVVIAGISHGAANTGVYASRRGFWRAVMHSGGWGNPGDAPVTPLTEWYSLAHTDDPSFDPIVGEWDRAGMLGERTSIDGASPPYGGAHKLITSVANDYPHCSVAVHESSPMSGDDYVFEPGWRYMYGVAELPQ